MNNSINSSILDKQYERLRSDVAKQDVYKEFARNANSIAPLENKAYLLKSRNPVSSVIIGAADNVKDVVELGKALATGKSNDNQLGRFNDLGLKLGGLGIASYLATRRGTKTKGVMEFLGFGAFFASMAMWPRLLISTPLKMRYGFDIRQEYVNAQGAKKRLYLDNQFIPDLYSDEEIDKVADKMGIDKSIPDYRQLTKEKMRVIALQGNTLWMLTAGFSPLLTSMICNLGERGVTKYIVNSQYKKVLSEVNGMENAIANRVKANPNFDADVRKGLNAMLDDRIAEPDKNFYTNVSASLDPFRHMIAGNDPDDLNLVTGLTSNTGKIKKRLQNDFNTLKSADNTSGLLDYDAILDRFKNTKMTIGSDDLQCADSWDNMDIYKSLKAQLEPLVEGAENKARTIGLSDFMEAYKNAIDGRDDKQIKDIVKGFIQETSVDNKASSKVVEDFCKSIKEIYDRDTRAISSQINGIEEFINSVVGQKYESAYTTLHLDSLNAFFENINPTKQELKIMRNSPDGAKRYLVDKLSIIAENDERYGKLISDVTTRQADLESRTIDKVIARAQEGANNLIKKAFDNIPDDSPLAFYKKEVGKLGEEAAANRRPLYERVISLFMEEKSAGIKATGHRYILAADLEKRIQSGELEQYWKELGGNLDFTKEVVPICRKIIYDSTMSDLSNKFYLSENGEEAVKIIKLLFGDSRTVNYQTGNPLYGLSKSTISNCNEKLLESLRATRNNIYNIYAQTLDHARQGHNLAGGISKCQKTQYSMVGESVSELVMETASQKFNDKTWLKVFGGIGIGVLAITLLAQTFFGKAKHEHLYTKKDAQGGVDANK